MRVAIVAESFLPHMNGVTGSVMHVLRHLAAEGHETLVVAPRAGEPDPTVHGDDLHGARAELLRSVPLPSYPQVRLVFARAARLRALLAEFRPDVVHLASPFLLGWQAASAAESLGVPTVAVYQTDVVAYAEKYGIPRAAASVRRHVTRLHRRATLTLAPSTAAMSQLEAWGVDRVRRWGRGVDADLFTPARRSAAWRTHVAAGEKIVGYVGRLAPEKQVGDLAAITGMAGVRLVIVGDGPDRPALARALPDALFAGHLSGRALAEAVASFDVFVHPGESETFGQTIQEALASGVPVVAPGVGGPTDLVRSSIDGWLYRPGDLADLRARVIDLVGDEGKRSAFAAAAREGVRGRTWQAVCAELIGHYRDAQRLHAADRVTRSPGVTRASEVSPPAPSLVAPRWSRYVALGDSLTEGLCDASRMPEGEFRGWADRLAQLLALERGGREPFRYANLAVRSRRVRDVVNEQIPRALELRPELVSILIGANDLVGPRPDVTRLADELAGGVRALRAAGIEVLLVTPFLPQRSAAALFTRRFASFAARLRLIAADTGAILLDLAATPDISAVDLWSDDRVHLRSRGHRMVAYRAAEALGVPDASALGGLDEALHVDDDPVAEGSWLRRDALPWLWRRLHGRTAGDGRTAKHADYVLIGGRDGTRSPATRSG